jgi:hypothetical protein
VTVDIRANRNRLQSQVEQALSNERLKRVGQNFPSNAGLVAKPTHPPRSGVQESVGFRLIGEGPGGLRPFADGLTVSAVTLRTTEGFNPGVLVGRDNLAGKLTADPIGLLGHEDAESEAACCHRSRTASGSSANNQ